LLNTLISYWKMDEATGATRNDSKGTNNLTDVAASVQGLAGKLNNGAYFGSGGASYLSVAANSTLDVTSDFTFSLWLRVDDISANRVAISKYDGSTSQYTAGHAPPNGFYFGCTSAAANAQVGATATAFAWYHLVCWFDSSDGKCRLRVNDTTTYVNITGTLNATNTGPLKIGAYIGIADGVNWVGLADEVGFWKRKLTSGEITALYGGGTPPPFSSFTT
jgi:hypothetical protein